MVFGIGRVVVTSYPSAYVSISFYIVAATVFICAFVLGIGSNFLKWLYPLFVMFFWLLFDVAVIYSNRVYLYLHHNHGVNDIRSVAEFTYFYILIAVVLLGLMIGVLKKAWIARQVS